MGPNAQAATVCCASTSRGLVGTASGSRVPLRIPARVTVAPSRSPRCLG